jgi:chemotaxis protein CheD
LVLALATSRTLQAIHRKLRANGQNSRRSFNNGGTDNAFDRRDKIGIGAFAPRQARPCALPTAAAAMTAIETILNARGKVSHVIQGEYRVSNDPSEVLTTFLGSCVATCMYDPVAQIGGINHFLLPGGADKSVNSYRYGLYSMELLINDLLKLGAQRDRLEAKLFGGAKMHDGLGHIGDANARFAINFLQAENIRCVSSSLGGAQARRIKFHPTTGRAQQLLLAGDLPPETQAAESVKPPKSDDVVFF